MALFTLRPITPTDRGFTLCALRPGAVIESRKRKPQIPQLGHHNIPIRDEIELEICWN